MKFSKILSFAVGPVFAAGVGAVTIPLLTWVFSPADIGRFNVLQTTSSLAVAICLLGLDQAYVREFHETDDARRLFRTTMRPSLIALSLALLAPLCFPSQFSAILFGLSSPAAVWTTLLTIVVMLLLRQLTLVVRMEERGLAFSLAQSLPKVVLVAGILIVWGTSSEADLLSLVIVYFFSGAAALIAVAAMTFRTWAKPAPSFGKDFTFKLLRYSVPLAATSIIYTAVSATGTYFLRFFSTFNEIALYSVAISAAGVVAVLQTIFSIIWAPILYKSASTGKELEVAKDATGAILAVCTMALALIGALSWLLDFVLPTEYSQVKFLVIGAAIQPLLYILSEVTSAGIGLTRRSLWALGSTTTAFLICLFASFLLVPRFAAAGAISASVIGYFALFALRTEASARIWVAFPRTKVYGLVISGVCLALCSVFGNDLIQPWLIGLWVVYGSISAYVCREAWIRFAAMPRADNSTS